MSRLPAVVSGHDLGGLFHVLPVIAIAVMRVMVIQGSKPASPFGRALL